MIDDSLLVFLLSPSLPVVPTTGQRNLLLFSSHFSACLLISRCASRGLFYNSTSGVAQFYNTDGNGGIQQLSKATWSTGWTHIVPVALLEGDYAPAGGFASLLFYNS